MKRFPEMSTKETAEGTIMCIETENKKEDSFQKQVLDRLCNLGNDLYSIVPVVYITVVGKSVLRNDGK